MNSYFHDDLLQDYSEAELAHHVRASPLITPVSDIYLLSATLLAKHFELPILEDMVKATDVARQLGIRIPCIKRIIAYKGGAYCIMEHIQRTTLEKT